MMKWMKRWGPAVLLMAIIFIASATPGSNLPDFGMWDIFTKKGGHLIGYALLAAAYFHGLNNGRGVTKLQITIAAAFAVLYAISDEWHQKFSAGRSPSTSDVYIDTAGAVMGLAVLYWIKKQGARSRKPEAHKRTTLSEPRP